MQPKTKEQKLVYSLHKKIPEICKTKIDWGKENLFEHLIYTTKKDCTCLECGYKWPKKGTYLADRMTCPKCNKQRDISKVRKRTFKEDDHFKIITTFQGYQVIRFVHIMRYLKVGVPAVYECEEVVQHWISPKGKRTIISMLSSGFNAWRNYWYWSGDMQVRASLSDSYFPQSITYPKQKIIPEIIRNGFTNEYFKIHPSSFFTMILSDPKAETLLKSGQLKLLASYYQYKNEIKKYWPSIRICLRNNYRISDPSTWMDQMKYLEQDNKDLLNAKYVCPKNLMKEHQKYIEKERKQWERERKQQEIEHRLKQIEEMAKENILYQKKKKKFLDFSIETKTLCIGVLKTVQDFYDESKELHHCLFSSRYYDRNESLILSARKGDNILETIEISLKEFKIVQCRGKHNQPTPYHNKIINLVNENMHRIKQLKSKRKETA
jgi:hypothetical protein